MTYRVTLDTLDPDAPRFRRGLVALRISAKIGRRGPNGDLRVTYTGSRAALRLMIDRYWEDADLYHDIRVAR